MVKKIQKITLILQLCLAFSLFLWLLFDPFMGEHFRIRHDMLIIENLRGDSALLEKASPQEIRKLEINQQEWAKLSTERKTQLIEAEGILLSRIQSSFLDKLLDGFYFLLVKTPFFELAWIFFAVLTSILCLKGKEGSASSTILLPLIVICYFVDLRSRPPEKTLYPSEKEIVHDYLKKPLSGDLTTQKESLLHGFDLYLIKEWAKEEPSTNPLLYKDQKSRGEFHFNLAELRTRMDNKFISSVPQEPTIFVVLYLIWNLYFFSIVNWKPKRQPHAI